MNRSVSIQALLVLAFAAFCCNADFVKEMQDMANNAKPKGLFEEDHVGYDLHKDMFYYVDSTVDQEYKKEAYMSTKVTLGGQQPDLAGREVRASVYPFAVAQKSFTRFRPNFNRFDVRSSVELGPGNGEYQYVGIYSGNKGSFVVNKLRAHLLRQLVNSVNHLLPGLDRTAASDAIGHEEVVEVVVQDLEENIQQVFRQVDDSIRGSMNDNDETSAAANVVIVTDHYVITATMGSGRVLGYFDDSLVDELTQPAHGGITQSFVFGDKRDRKGQSTAQVRVTPRTTVDDDGDSRHMQLVLVESPRAASHLSNTVAFNTVLQQVNQHKRQAAHEQEMYSSSVSRLMDTIGSGTKFFDRVFGDDNDASIALIGLTKEYEHIH